MSEVCTCDSSHNGPCIQLAFLYSEPCLANFFHCYLMQLTPEKVNPHTECLYWQGTLPANLTRKTKLKLSFGNRDEHVKK